jgi:hypothetical protein
MITGETARKVKNMSVPELNTYLFAIYSAGYSDGFSDRLATAARAAAIEPQTDEEAAPCV